MSAKGEHRPVSDDQAGEEVAVYRPVMPRAEMVARYLVQLDQSRVYANGGALVRALEARLASLLRLPNQSIVLSASGTAALMGAILARAGRPQADRTICICPGYTFVAAPLAAEHCGYEVRFADVEPETWVLDPARLLEDPRLERTGLVIAAAPYGRRLFSQAEWTDFTCRTGIPVVIDAAAGIEALVADSSALVGATPVVLSLHATKPFSVGEGGAIISSDLAFLRKAMALMNYSFDGTRVATGPGFNGKMSEYHAAVGLAELDGWAEKRAAHLEVALSYAREAARHHLRIHTAPEVHPATCCSKARRPQARKLPRRHCGAPVSAIASGTVRGFIPSRTFEAWIERRSRRSRISPAG